MSKIPVFDIGDTLIPCYRLQNNLIHERVEMEGQEVPEFDVNKFRIYNPGEVRDYFQKYEIDGIDAEKLVQEYKRRERRYLERNDVFSFLKRCSAEFGEIGFISDNSIEGKKWLKELLKEHNVPYNGFVVSEEVGVEKPDLEIFEAFLEKRVEPADRFMYIGNNVERDKAAVEAGMGFVWLKKFETFGNGYSGKQMEELNFKKIRRFCG